MKYLRKNLIPILVLLLIISTVFLIKIMSDKDVLQKNIDRIFTNAIRDSMDGLAKDYSKIDAKEKIQYSYQTVTNLKYAQDVFHFTSYKNYDDYFQILNRLYLYLSENYNENNEIDGKGKIYEFLLNSLYHPNDNQLILDFNSYLDEKTK